jgi:hypothetical protein
MSKKSSVLEYKIVDLNEANIDEYGAFCLQSKKKTQGYKEKFEWIKERFKEGLRLKLLLVNEGAKRGFRARGFIEKSLGINVQGMSKRNTIRTFTLPEILQSEFEVAKTGFSYKTERFLNPPVKLFGIPAMRKLADEILEWDNKKCFEHMVTYATTPPLLPKTFENSHGMRFWQATVLDALGNKYNVRVWTEASTLFTRSEERIKKLCEAALNLNRQGASEHLLEIAEIEEQAYRLLKAA